MRGLFKKAAAIFVGIILMVSITACGGLKPTEYVDAFQNLINENTTLYQQLTTGVEAYLTDFTEEQKTQILTTLESLKEKYGELEALEAPKAYVDVQPMFQEASVLAISAITIYLEEFTKLTKETFTESNTELLERLEEADKLMEQANEKMIAAVTLVKEIDGTNSEEESSSETESGDGEGSSEETPQE